MAEAPPPFLSGGPDKFDVDKKNSQLYDALIRFKTIEKEFHGAGKGFTYMLTVKGWITCNGLCKSRDLDINVLSKAQRLSLVVYGDENLVNEG